MQNSRNNKLTYIISIILLVLIGCSIEQKHKILTTLFDDVDQKKFAVSTLSKDSLRAIGNASRDELLRRTRPDLVVHQPYKEKRCDKCHTPDKHLLDPMPKLCYRCHKNFSETYQYVHGPVASGSCLKCHNQHSSKFEKLLVRQGQDVCLYCHKSSLVLKNKNHRDIEDAACTLCHNPHGGNTRFMVKESIARNLTGMSLVNERLSRNFHGQIYNKVPGDIKEGTEISITDRNGIVIGTSVVEKNGYFQIRNVDSTQDYTIKVKNDIPASKILIEDYKNDVITKLEKTKGGRFVLDKPTIQAANEAVVKLVTRPEEKPSVEPPAETKRAEQEQSEKQPENAVAKNEPENNAGKNETGNTNEPVKQAVSAPEKTAQSENKESKETVKGVTGEQKEPAKNEGVPEQENKSVDGNRNDVNKTEINTLGAPVNINPAGDNTPVQIKLAGRTLAFYKGTMVCFLNDSGDIVAVAKVNQGGNFIIEKLLMDNNISVPEEDPGVYSQIVFFDRNMEKVQNLKKTRDAKGNFNYLPIGGGGGIQTDKSNSVKANGTDAKAGDAEGEAFSVVYFELGKTGISTGTKAELIRVAEYMKKHLDVDVVLKAHTDSRGSAKYNQVLSEKRANAAVEFLVSRGISRRRITGRGFGKSKLKNKCADGVPCSEEEHSVNRRVEVFLTDK